MGHLHGRYLLFAVFASSIWAVTAPKSPTLLRPTAGQTSVRGQFGNDRDRIRIKVFDGSGEEKQENDVVVSPHNKGVFIAGLDKPLEPGQVVQAFVVIGDSESLPSAPVTVAAAAPDPKPDPPPPAAAPIPPQAPTPSARPTVAPAPTSTTSPVPSAPPVPLTAAPAPANSGGGSTADEANKKKTLGPVILTDQPKEGQNFLYVSVPKADKESQLSVYMDGNPVRLINSKHDQTTSVDAGTNGETTVQLVTALDAGQCVRVVEFKSGEPPNIDPDNLVCPGANQSKGKAAEAANYAVSAPKLVSAFFDYGRIRTYLAAGTLFSYDGGSFSQPSVFLDLSSYRNWLWGGVESEDQGDEKRRHVMIDTFFEARLTTVPVVACTPVVTSSSGNASSGSQSTAACPNQQSATTNASQISLQTALASPKAGELIGGVSIPILMSTWKSGSIPYGFSMGAISKVGFITPVGSQSSNTAQVIAPQPFYTNFGFGNRFGFHKLTYSKNVSPELLSYVDVLMGRYSNFDYNPFPNQRYARPWRFAFEGLLKVPTTPLYIGFSANVHQNFGLNGSKTVGKERDDLRFFFGTKIDAGKLFDTVGRVQ